jgi:hypothetical protein
VTDAVLGSEVSETPRWDAVIVHPDDDVATALRPLAAGEPVRIDGAAAAGTAAEAIPLGGKLALRDLPAGGPVRKYGEVIGETTAPVPPGGLVHVHNLRSRRARAA